MKLNHVLVTGGAGYIGSILVPFLLNEGYAVTVIDNLMYGQRTLWQCFSNPHFRFIKGDANDESLLVQVLSSVDIIIPLAAIVGAKACKVSPILAKLVNYSAIQLIIKNTDSQHKIIFPSTNSVYGIGIKDSWCTEESNVAPISYYGELKAEIEKALLKTKKSVCLRLATIFGISARMRLDLIVNDYTYQACHNKNIILYDSHLKRNHIHIDDVAQAFIFTIKNFDKMCGQVFNVGLTNTNLSKQELCEKIKSYIPDFYVHIALEGEDSDKRDYMVCNRKIESLGWKAQKGLDEGIRDIISAYEIIHLNQFLNH